MPSITFDLETVTPLFLAGADQTTAELRPPAFRGALRYWFRAIIGNYYWNSPAQLKELESAILGDVGANGCSKIILRLSRLPNDLKPLPVRLDQEKDPGLSYLWFSMKGSGGRNPRPQRQAIGTREPLQFSLTFSTRPDPGNLELQKRNLLVAANCFWLAVNLSGFGSRERRGAGSLRAIQVRCQGLDEDTIPKFSMKYKEAILPKFLKGELVKARKSCYSLLEFNNEYIPVIDQLPDLEILGKYTSKIYLVKEPYTSWKEALEDMGQRYKNYRQQIELKKRAIFGLPLKDFDMASRRPSPLRIKVVRSLNSYYCLLVSIKAKFPEDSKISNPQNPGYGVLNDFLASFSEDEIERIG